MAPFIGVVVFWLTIGVACAGEKISEPMELASSEDLRPYFITDDYGGQLSSYIEKYGMLRRAGAKVVIDGPCVSACTIVLGLVPLENICATRYGRLVFHTALNAITNAFSQSGTNLAWSFYPPNVVKRLSDSGMTGKEAHPDGISFLATDFVQLCK